MRMKFKCKSTSSSARVLSLVLCGKTSLRCCTDDCRWPSDESSNVALFMLFPGCQRVTDWPQPLTSYIRRSLISPCHDDISKGSWLALTSYVILCVQPCIQQPGREMPSFPYRQKRIVSVFRNIVLWTLLQLLIGHEFNQSVTPSKDKYRLVWDGLITDLITPLVNVSLLAMQQNQQVYVIKPCHELEREKQDKQPRMDHNHLA